MIASLILIISLSILVFFAIDLLRKGKISGFFILTTTLSAIFLITNPHILGLVANIFGVGRGADLLLYLSFSVAIVLYLNIIKKIMKLELIVTKIIRDNAINLRSK